MEITHELLISLGFTQIPGRPLRYRYKNFTGRLEPEAGIFFFHGFSPGIFTPEDLKYLLMMVDFREGEESFPFSTNDN